jgi:hypothetical protein
MSTGLSLKGGYEKGRKKRRIIENGVDVTPLYGEKRGAQGVATFVANALEWRTWLNVHSVRMCGRNRRTRRIANEFC